MFDEFFEPAPPAPDYKYGCMYASKEKLCASALLSLSLGRAISGTDTFFRTPIYTFVTLFFFSLYTSLPYLFVPFYFYRVFLHCARFILEKKREREPLIKNIFFNYALLCIESR